MVEKEDGFTATNYNQFSCCAVFSKEALCQGEKFSEGSSYSHLHTRTRLFDQRRNWCLLFVCPVMDTRRLPCVDQVSLYGGDISDYAFDLDLLACTLEKLYFPVRLREIF